MEQEEEGSQEGRVARVWRVVMGKKGSSSQNRQGSWGANK